MAIVGVSIRANSWNKSVKAGRPTMHLRKDCLSPWPYYPERAQSPLSQKLSRVGPG